MCVCVRERAGGGGGCVHAFMCACARMPVVQVDGAADDDEGSINSDDYRERDSVPFASCTVYGADGTIMNTYGRGQFSYVVRASAAAVAALARARARARVRG